MYLVTPARKTRCVVGGRKSGTDGHQPGQSKQQPTPDPCPESHFINQKTRVAAEVGKAVPPGQGPNAGYIPTASASQ